VTNCQSQKRYWGLRAAVASGLCTPPSRVLVLFHFALHSAFFALCSVRCAMIGRLCAGGSEGRVSLWPTYPSAASPCTTAFEHEETCTEFLQRKIDISEHAAVLPGQDTVSGRSKATASSNEQIAATTNIPAVNPDSSGLEPRTETATARASTEGLHCKRPTTAAAAAAVKDTLRCMHRTTKLPEPAGSRTRTATSSPKHPQQSSGRALRKARPVVPSNKASPRIPAASNWIVPATRVWGAADGRLLSKLQGKDTGSEVSSSGALEKGVARRLYPEVDVARY
jgi:hypothetical protein